MNPLPVRPLPAILALGALSSFAAALILSSHSAKCVRRSVTLGALAFYAWMVV
jgi:hypothetical protein